MGLRAFTIEKIIELRLQISASRSGDRHSSSLWPAQSISVNRSLSYLRQVATNEDEVCWSNMSVTTSKV